MRPRRFEREIEGLSISLDGYDWESCTFENCKILVAEGNFSLVGCGFKNCGLHLSGRAKAIGKLIQLFAQGEPLEIWDNKDSMSTNYE